MMQHARSIAKTLLKDGVACLPGPMQRAVWRARYRQSGVEPEIALLPRIVPPGSLAIDIGANKGRYALYLHRLAGRVICFEPHPAVARRLTRLFGNASSVTVLNVALGDREAMLELRVPCVQGKEFDEMSSLAAKFAGRRGQDATVVGGAVSEYRTHRVPVRTLDSFRHPEVGFVKIDVEGFESQVIDGARETLLRCQPNILIEIEQRHIDVDISEIFGRFSDLGYRGSFLSKGRLLDLEKFDPATMQEPDAADGRGLYVNNFVFTTRALETAP
jgi:FkbM family methyltransferase